MTEETIKQILKFRDDRDWKQFHNPKDLAISISLEAAELLEVFQWSGTDVSNEGKQEKIKEELADLIGTDAHRAEGDRSVSMAEGASWLQRHCSPEYAARLLYKNAAHILDNTDMEDIE